MHVTATSSARHRFDYISIYYDVFSKWSLLHGIGKVPRLKADVVVPFLKL